MRNYTSDLYDETTFYQTFLRDVGRSTKEVIIESSYITAKRMKKLSRVFSNLVGREVKVYILTRDPNEHVSPMREESEIEIRKFEVIGVQVLLCTGNDHRKLAIVDRNILWEGSLNILSQTNSREIMRRIDSKALTEEMFTFLKFGKYIY